MVLLYFIFIEHVFAFHPALKKLLKPLYCYFFIEQTFFKKPFKSLLNKKREYFVKNEDIKIEQSDGKKYGNKSKKKKKKRRKEKEKLSE